MKILRKVMAIAIVVAIVTSGIATGQGVFADANKAKESDTTVAEPVSSQTAQTAETEQSALPSAEVVGKGGIIIDLTPSVQTAFYTNESVTSRVKIIGNRLDAPLDKPYMEFIIPAKLYKGGKVLTTDQYIDSFSVGAIGIPIVESTQTREEGGNTIIRVNFNEIDLATKVEIPYVFSFTDRLTPGQLKLKPEIKLYDKNGNLLVEATDKEYSPKYDDRTGTLFLSPDIYLDGQLVNGGISDSNDVDVISQNGAEAVPFAFEYREYGTEYKMRMIETLTVTDVLPTYLDKDGNLVTAKFEKAINPNWTDNGDGTVSCVVKYKESDFTGDLRADVNWNLKKEMLNLKFPNARINKDGKPVIFTNKVIYTGVPFNPSPGEEYVAQDTITFKMTANDFSGSGCWPRETT